MTIPPTLTIYERMLLGNLQHQSSKAHVVCQLEQLLKSCHDETVLSVIRGLLAKLLMADQEAFCKLIERCSTKEG